MYDGSCMKKIIVLIAAVYGALMFTSCGNDDPFGWYDDIDNSKVAFYSFSVVHGKWMRSGNIGGMGVTKLESYTDPNNGREIMIWNMTGDSGGNLYFECRNLNSPCPSLYRFEWWPYDKDTGITDYSAGKPFMHILLAVESQNDIYIKTDAKNMSGLTMRRTE